VWSLTCPHAIPIRLGKRETCSKRRFSLTGAESLQEHVERRYHGAPPVRARDFIDNAADRRATSLTPGGVREGPLPALSTPLAMLAMCGTRVGAPSAARLVAPARSPPSSRHGLRVVAMGRRSKSKKARRDAPDTAEAPVAAPTSASPAPAAPAAPAARPAEQRGPERLSANDWAEIEAENARAREGLGSAPAPSPAGTSLLDKALSADAMLLFAVDGAVPEVVNGRVAMFGFFTALIKELATGESFTSQLSYNLTHGVSFAIIALVTAGTLAPCAMANPNETPFEGSGIAKFRPEPRAKAGRQYLCDPRAVDCEGLPGRDTPLGRIGFGPLAETVNGRAAMVGLVATFVIEGAMKHGLFRG
jgi:hypothetical protein